MNIGGIKEKLYKILCKNDLGNTIFYRRCDVSAIQVQYLLDTRVDNE